MKLAKVSSPRESPSKEGKSQNLDTINKESIWKHRDKKGLQ